MSKAQVPAANPIAEREARRATARLSEDRWKLAAEFKTWFDGLLFEERPEEACERWMAERFGELAPVDRGLLRYACLRNEDGTYRDFRRRKEG